MARTRSYRRSAGKAAGQSRGINEQLDIIKDDLRNEWEFGTYSCPKDRPSLIRLLPSVYRDPDDPDAEPEIEAQMNDDMDTLLNPDTDLLDKIGAAFFPAQLVRCFGPKNITFLSNCLYDDSGEQMNPYSWDPIKTAMLRLQWKMKEQVFYQRSRLQNRVDVPASWFQKLTSQEMWKTLPDPRETWLVQVIILKYQGHSIKGGKFPAVFALPAGSTLVKDSVTLLDDDLVPSNDECPTGEERRDASGTILPIPENTVLGVDLFDLSADGSVLQISRTEQGTGKKKKISYAVRPLDAPSAVPEALVLESWRDWHEVLKLRTVEELMMLVAENYPPDMVAYAFENDKTYAAYLPEIERRMQEKLGDSGYYIMGAADNIKEHEKVKDLEAMLEAGEFDEEIERNMQEGRKGTGGTGFRSASAGGRERSHRRPAGAPEASEDARDDNANNSVDHGANDDNEFLMGGDDVIDTQDVGGGEYAPVSSSLANLRKRVPGANSEKTEEPSEGDSSASPTPRRRRRLGGK